MINDFIIFNKEAALNKSLSLERRGETREQSVLTKLWTKQDMAILRLKQLSFMEV